MTDPSRFYPRSFQLQIAEGRIPTSVATAFADVKDDEFEVAHDGEDDEDDEDAVSQDAAEKSDSDDSDDSDDEGQLCLSCPSRPPPPPLFHLPFLILIADISARLLSRWVDVEREPTPPPAKKSKTASKSKKSLASEEIAPSSTPASAEKKKEKKDKVRFSSLFLSLFTVETTMADLTRLSGLGRRRNPTKNLDISFKTRNVETYPVSSSSRPLPSPPTLRTIISPVGEPLLVEVLSPHPLFLAPTLCITPP